MSDLRRHRPQVPALVVWLVLLWVALWGDVSVANVVSGLGVAIAIVAIARRDGSGTTSVHIRPWRAFVFLGYCLAKLIEANLVLAWEIVTPRNTIRTGIVGVVVESTSDGLLTLVANVITLTPGSVTIEVTRDGKEATIFVHVLHLRDVDAVRADVARLVRLASAAFGPRPGDALDRATAQGVVQR